MTKDEAREILLSDEGLMADRTWYITSGTMSCGDGCCYDTFDNIEDALDALEFYSKDFTKIGR